MKSEAACLAPVMLNVSKIKPRRCTIDVRTACLEGQRVFDRGVLEGVRVRWEKVEISLGIRPIDSLAQDISSLIDDLRQLGRACIIRLSDHKGDALQEIHEGFMLSLGFKALDEPPKSIQPFRIG